MDANYHGTEIEKGRGNDEFFEVEALIKQTLEESKLLEPVPTPAPNPVPTPIASEFKGTTISTPTPPAPVTSVKDKEASGYDATFKEYKAGDIVKGKVLKVDPSGVLVDIKYKADGLIPTEELSEHSFSSPAEIVKVGDIVDVYIENLENKEGYVVLSKKRAEQEVRWNAAYEAYKNRTALEGKVLQVLKGGLVVDCGGIRGFVPASQVARKDGEELEAFKDRVIAVKVIELNRRQGKIFLSHRMAAGDREKVDNQKIIEELEAGQVRRGKVASLKSFGAFVDLGGIEGLIHLSELSWKRVKHPSELLKVGQELGVFVLGVDKTNKKVSLGLKELQPDPWATAADYFKPGQIVKAKILRFAKFGAFAELDHDLEGLIHISEMSKEQVLNPSDAAKIGDVVDVKVLRVLPEEQRIGLSMRAVLLQKEKEEMKRAAPPEEEKEEAKKVTIGDMIAQKEKEKAERETEETVIESEEEEAT
jgi:ribosomal protein S1